MSKYDAGHERNDMALIECTCPHCGGTVNMEEDLISGFCTYCGRKVINDKAVIGNVKVTMDRSSDVINTLKLAKYSMYDGDANAARVLLDKAMLMNSENSDVWYMDAVMDRRNAAKDIARARQYPSFGIFTEDEVEVYKNFNANAGSMVLIMTFIIVFSLVFACIPISIIFERYYLLGIAVAVGATVLVSEYLIIRSRKPRIPMPVFADEDGAAMDAAEKETSRKD